jgi:hypothetical protein
VSVARIAGGQLGVMIVQMLDDSRIRVETLPGSRATTADFSASARARTYVR